MDMVGKCVAVEERSEVVVVVPVVGVVFAVVVVTGVAGVFVLLRTEDQLLL
jgi:hypothetical protein